MLVFWFPYSNYGKIENFRVVLFSRYFAVHVSQMSPKLDDAKIFLLRYFFTGSQHILQILIIMVYVVQALFLYL